MTNGLSFKTLREANKRRLPLFKNAKGAPAHSSSDGADWSDAEWLGAVLGELGEFANLKKKVQRGDIAAEDAKPLLAKELADVAIYLDLLAFRLGIDLGVAITGKWNEVSERIGVPMVLSEADDDWHFTRALTEQEAELAARPPSPGATLNPLEARSLAEWAAEADRNGTTAWGAKFDAVMTVARRVADAIKT